MNRCHLKGAQGDSLHAVLCAADYNIHWLLRMIAKKGVPFLQTLFLRLLEHSGLAAMGRWAERKIANLAVKCPGGFDWMLRFIWLWAESGFFRDDYVGIS